jgi:ATP/ADP translocase
MIKRLLEKHLKIYVHEASRFLWISSIFFLIFFFTAIFRTYVDAAFVKRYGPQYIPWMLVINAGLTFVVFGISDRLTRRFMDQYLLSGFMVLYGVSTTGIFFAVKADYSLSYPILYQLLYLLDSILLVYLWNIVGDLFDARQGKRLFPLITAGQVLGTTLGSFATKPLTNFAGDDETLLMFSAACIATALLLCNSTYAKEIKTRQKSTGGQTSVKKKLSEIPALMKDYPIVRYLMITGLIPNLLLPIVLYQFNVIANHTFSSMESLISFLSIFRGITTATTFVLLFFMGRLYQSIGLTNSSLVQPLNFALLFGSLSTFFNIYVAAYGQFSTILIQRAVAGPVNKILFSIIPSDLAVWSRTFIRGSVVKIGMLTGSLTMIVLKPVVSAKDLSFIALAASLYWVYETLIFRKHYKRILKQVIVEKEIDFDQIESVRNFDSGGSAMEIGPMSVGERPDDILSSDVRPPMDMAPEVALKLIEDENPATRAEAAASFILSRDVRGVGKLIRRLEDSDDDVRKTAIEALMGYREVILPFLEVCLVEAPPRTKQGILEVIRLSGLKEFEMVPFLGKSLALAYSNLIAMRAMKPLDESLSVEMLKNHLQELQEETLSLVFQALWVYHADMRLMYQALKSETASIAIELVETSIGKEIAPYLIPLIEDIPIDEKIEKGRKIFPVIRQDSLERVLTFLADSEDPVTRMLALFVIGERFPKQSFVPIVEARLEDEFQYVREIAEYALRRSMNEVAEMPDVTERIAKLKQFSIFEGMGVRELHAIASVLNVESFNTGDMMINEGESNSSIYLIVSGKVTIYADYGTEKQKEKVTIGEGSFLGELSLFSRQPPNATCIAAESTDVFVLRHHQFQEIMRIYPQIGINLCRFFVMKLRQVKY